MEKQFNIDETLDKELENAFYELSLADVLSEDSFNDVFWKYVNDEPVFDQFLFYYAIKQVIDSKTIIPIVVSTFKEFEPYVSIKIETHIIIENSDIDDGLNWLAIDENGSLWAYADEPFKDEAFNCWEINKVNSNAMSIFNFGNGYLKVENWASTKTKIQR